MKKILFLLLFPCFALAQYQGNGNQKITLGEQTTADGLVWRGRLADTANLLTNKLDTSVYIVLDTGTRAMWYYRASTTPKWTRLVDSLNNLQGTLSVAKGGTGSATQNFVDLTTTQSIGGAKTFTSALTATRFNPTANTATETGMFLPAANTLGFSTNGTNKMTLDASGSLGVGYTNPSFYGKLAVNGALYFGNTSTTAGVLVRAVGISNTTVSIGTLWSDSAPLISVENRSTTANTAAGYAMSVGGGSAIAGILGIAESTSQASLGLYTGGSGTVAEKMRITSGGNVGIGTTSPTAALHLKAGTATASSAPLKFTSGTNLTTAEAGAMEFNGTNLFFSPSTTRHTVNHGLTGSATLDFPSTTTLLSADLTITVTGAADGDVVSLGVPNAAVNANTCYTAWVSATNTVTVRFNNYSSGTVDPASGTFKVFITK